MDHSIQPMSLSEYADQQTRLGAKVICRSGVFWRKIRPFFYRPLLPVESYSKEAVQVPVTWPSGFQYVTDNRELANSSMNFIMLDELQGYSLGSLTCKRRQRVKLGAQQFQVRPLQNSDELKMQGHKVYLSFYQRTLYPYKQDRRNYRAFCMWIDTLFSSPKTILLGGFGPNGLAAITSLYWVNRTLIFSTLICESEALRKNLGELMFHEIRQLAAKHTGIKQIYVRNYQGGNSLDQYYLNRGCQLVRKPSRLEITSPFKTLLRCFLPRKYDLLRGND